jgi:hypothetical protein
MIVPVHVMRNTYGSYQSLLWSTSWELNHSRGPGVSHRDYFAWSRGISLSEQQEWFSQGYLYIWWNLKAYGGNICNWKWIKWLRRLFKKNLNNFFLRHNWPRPTDHFAGVYGHRPSPGRSCRPINEVGQCQMIPMADDVIHSNWASKGIYSLFPKMEICILSAQGGS